MSNVVFEGTDDGAVGVEQIVRAARMEVSDVKIDSAYRKDRVNVLQAD